MVKPYLIDFPKLGKDSTGYICVVELHKALPFEVQRTFWTYDTPESFVRGNHAHYNTEQVLFAVAGRITVTTEMPGGATEIFHLQNPHQGLYVPPHVWHTMQYTPGAVQLVYASTHYDETDYIRDYEVFRAKWKHEA
ncbi:sugar 3,4-ketoisomerase [Hymenobacter koreensis]|uniref:FdtA/QdtA family cupin domain-containing protein n=1 Tax=Hymenobacter koreensis TaxID=1084523 RepID=A0ABP8IV15_9BACT